jgi:hypothetical protein
MLALTQDLAISINDLTVGFGEKPCLTGFRWMSAAVKSSVWSEHQAAVNRFCSEPLLV